jgi:hypothetical protein
LWFLSTEIAQDLYRIVEQMARNKWTWCNQSTCSIKRTTVLVKRRGGKWTYLRCTQIYCWSTCQRTAACGKCRSVACRSLFSCWCTSRAPSGCKCQNSHGTWWVDGCEIRWLRNVAEVVKKERCQKREFKKEIVKKESSTRNVKKSSKRNVK